MAQGYIRPGRHLSPALGRDSHAGRLRRKRVEKKLRQAVDASKERPLWRLLTGLGIRLWAKSWPRR
ncbi:MAG: hypothetical protein R3A10_13390 [Caldilineaceae bacterium]